MHGEAQKGCSFGSDAQVLEHHPTPFCVTENLWASNAAVTHKAVSRGIKRCLGSRQMQWAWTSFPFAREPPWLCLAGLLYVATTSSALPSLTLVLTLTVQLAYIVKLFRCLFNSKPCITCCFYVSSKLSVSVSAFTASPHMSVSKSAQAVIPRLLSSIFSIASIKVMLPARMIPPLEELPFVTTGMNYNCGTPTHLSG